MKIEKGIQNNCSETVIRINKDDFELIPDKLINDAWGDESPMGGYSSMKGTKDKKCLYFYQMSGNDVIEWLEQHKILYEIEAPFGAITADLEEIMPSEEEENIEEFNDGGGGSYYRRKPYA